MKLPEHERRQAPRSFVATWWLVDHMEGGKQGWYFKDKSSMQKKSLSTQRKTTETEEEHDMVTSMHSHMRR